MSALAKKKLFRRRFGQLFRRRSSGVLVAAGMPLEHRQNNFPERCHNNKIEQQFLRAQCAQRAPWPSGGGRGGALELVAWQPGRANRGAWLSPQSKNKDRAKVERKQQRKKEREFELKQLLLQLSEQGNHLVLPMALQRT